MLKNETQYLNEFEIVAALVSELTAEDKGALINMYKKEDDLSVLHHGYGTYIRNTFKLWEAANPLTHQWFKDCAFAEGGEGQHQYMKDGVDYHPQHPDAVSFEIIKQVWHSVVDGA